VAKKAAKGGTKAPAAKAKAAPKPAAKPAKEAKDAAPKAKAAPAPAKAAAPAAGGAAGAPAGQHTVTPHLVVRNSAQAIDFYKHAFGAQEKMRMPGPDGFSIMHAEIIIGDSHVYLADENPQNQATKAPQSLGATSVSVHLYVADTDAVVKKAEENGAKVLMPPGDMFWGDRFAMVLDPFGHAWSIATHKEDVSLPEMGKRAEKFFAQMAKPPE